MPHLSFNAEKCTGCRYCELVCSARWEGEFNPRMSRIRAVREGLPERTKIIYCRQCEDAPCLKVCQTGALFQDETSGAIIVNSDRCTGCELCIESCQYNVIFIHPCSGLATKCDLCGGKPECVDVCQTGALSLESETKQNC